MYGDGGLKRGRDARVLAVSNDNADGAGGHVLRPVFSQMFSQQERTIEGQVQVSLGSRGRSAAVDIRADLGNTVPRSLRGVCARRIPR